MAPDRNLYKTILCYISGRDNMENLTLLGIVYVVVGLVLSIFMILTLILLIFGLVLMLMGKKNASRGYTRYPMFMPCPACGKSIDASSMSCPICEKPTQA